MRRKNAVESHEMFGEKIYDWMIDNEESADYMTNDEKCTY